VSADPPLNRSFERSLTSLCARYDLAPDCVRSLGVLLGMLVSPAAPTSIHDPSRGVEVHIADSLVGLDVADLRSAGLIADLGAGAGLPGLVLAAALPEARIVLIEAARRKCDFMRLARDAMGLQNADVAWARAETWSDGLGRCDVVCARALAALPVLCEYAAPLLRDGGLLVGWKGKVAASESADAEAAAAELGLALEEVRPVRPFAGSERRTLHLFRKVAPTPSRYPRRPGVATKRPLSAENLR
jgi:16S rRNA (guanine527-N7)-methyltransferase